MAKVNPFIPGLHLGPLSLSKGVGAAPIPFDGVLGWGSNDATFGVRVDDPATIGSWNTWIGAPAGQQMVFANGSTWTELLDNATAEAERGADYPLHWTLEMPPTATLAEIKAGDHDNHLTTFYNIAAGARPLDTRIPIRKDQEQNGFGHPWDAVLHPTDFIGAFQRSTALGQNLDDRFRSIWCPGLGSTDPTPSWPGPEYVDVIGGDFYIPGNFGSDMVANWRLIQSGYAWSINTMVAFARAQGKPIAFDEVGFGKDHGEILVSSLRDVLTRYRAMLAFWNYYNVDNADLAPNFNTRLDLGGNAATGVRVQTEFGPSPPANLFSNPTNFSNAAWSKVATTITSGQADSQGGTAAYAMKETTATSQHDVVQAPTKDGSSHHYWLSLVWKPLGGRAFMSAQVYQDSFGSGGVSYFDASNGNTGATTFGYGGIGTPDNFTAPAEGGFFSSGYQFTSSTGTSISVQLEAASADGTDSYAGDITKGLYLESASLRKVA